MHELKKYIRTYNPCDECSYGIDKRDGSGNDSMCKICEFTALLNSRAQPENKPLTLEQLDSMDGEPVYIVDTYHGGLPHWAVWDTAMIGDDEAKSYGKTWFAYAQKPEQEENS